MCVILNIKKETALLNYVITGEPPRSGRGIHSIPTRSLQAREHRLHAIQRLVFSARVHGGLQQDMGAHCLYYQCVLEVSDADEGVQPQDQIRTAGDTMAQDEIAEQLVFNSIVFRLRNRRHIPEWQWLLVLYDRFAYTICKYVLKIINTFVCFNVPSLYVSF